VRAGVVGLNSGFSFGVMKHNPFQSNYREEFEVVEQRLGNVTLYPHTDQLPQLHRALNL
jgi:hypothetical protein